jgi:hypothetical protein
MAPRVLILRIIIVGIIKMEEEKVKLSQHLFWVNFNLMKNNNNSKWILSRVNPIINSMNQVHNKIYYYNNSNKL